MKVDTYFSDNICLTIIKSAHMAVSTLVSRFIDLLTFLLEDNTAADNSVICITWNGKYVVTGNRALLVADAIMTKSTKQLAGLLLMRGELHNSFGYNSWKYLTFVELYANYTYFISFSSDLMFLWPSHWGSKVLSSFDAQVVELFFEWKSWPQKITDKIFTTVAAVRKGLKLDSQPMQLEGIWGHVWRIRRQYYCGVQIWRRFSSIYNWKGVKWHIPVTSTKNGTKSASRCV